MKNPFGQKLISILLLTVFGLGEVLPSHEVQAQIVAKVSIQTFNHPAGIPFVPAIMAGMILDQHNPLHFDFIVDTGDDRLEGERLRRESDKLIQYFMAALTVPENDLWVNLSPTEKDRVIADGLGRTALGRDMLAMDLELKKVAAGLVAQKNEEGSVKQEVRSKREEVGQSSKNDLENISSSPTPESSSSPLLSSDLLSRIWIVPDKAVVYVKGNHVFVAESHLRVMFETDQNSPNPSLDKEGRVRFSPSSNEEGNWEVFPSLEKRGLRGVESTDHRLQTKDLLNQIEFTVNTSAQFAPLRQIYHAMILATWYKKNLKASVNANSRSPLDFYLDQNLTNGIDLADKNVKDKIYNQYLNAFRDGVSQSITEEYDPTTQEILAKKYITGGEDFALLSKKTTLETATIVSTSWLNRRGSEKVRVRAGLNINNNSADFAMTGDMNEDLPELKDLGPFIINDEDSLAKGLSIESLRSLEEGLDAPSVVRNIVFKSKMSKTGRVYRGMRLAAMDLVKILSDGMEPSRVHQASQFSTDIRASLYAFQPDTETVYPKVDFLSVVFEMEKPKNGSLVVFDKIDGKQFTRVWAFDLSQNKFTVIYERPELDVALDDAFSKDLAMMGKDGSRKPAMSFDEAVAKVKKLLGHKSDLNLKILMAYLAETFLGLRANHPLIPLEDNQLTNWSDSEIQALGNELRKYWKQYHWDDEYGDFNEHLGSILSGRAFQPQTVFGLYKNLSLLMRGTNEERLLGLWVLSLRIITHLQAFGSHLEVLPDGTEIFVDYELLILATREYLSIYLQEKDSAWFNDPIERRPVQGEAATIFEDANKGSFYHWALTMLLRPMHYNALYRIQSDFEGSTIIPAKVIEHVKSRYGGARGQMWAALERIFKDLKYVNSNGYEISISDNEALKVMMSVFYYKSGYSDDFRSPYSTLISAYDVIDDFERIDRKNAHGLKNFSFYNMLKEDVLARLFRQKFGNEPKRFCIETALRMSGKLEWRSYHLLLDFARSRGYSVNGIKVEPLAEDDSIFTWSQIMIVDLIHDNNAVFGFSPDEEDDGHFLVRLEAENVNGVLVSELDRALTYKEKNLIFLHIRELIKQRISFGNHFFGPDQMYLSDSLKAVFFTDLHHATKYVTMSSEEIMQHYRLVFDRKAWKRLDPQESIYRALLSDEIMSQGHGNKNPIGKITVPISGKDRSVVIDQPIEEFLDRLELPKGRQAIMVDLGMGYHPITTQETVRKFNGRLKVIGVDTNIPKYVVTFLEKGIKYLAFYDTVEGKDTLVYLVRVNNPLEMNYDYVEIDDQDKPELEIIANKRRDEYSQNVNDLLEDGLGIIDYSQWSKGITNLEFFKGGFDLAHIKKPVDMIRVSNVFGYYNTNQIEAALLLLSTRLKEGGEVYVFGNEDFSISFVLRNGELHPKNILLKEKMLNINKQFPWAMPIQEEYDAIFKKVKKERDLKAEDLDEINQQLVAKGYLAEVDQHGFIKINLERGRGKELLDSALLVALDRKLLFTQNDPYFFSAVDYFNNEIIGPDPRSISPLTWEKAMMLFAKMRGDDLDSRFLEEHNLRLASKLKDQWLEGFNLYFEDQDQLLNYAVNLFAEIVDNQIFVEAGKGFSLLKDKSPDSEGSFAPHGEGHHRWAWFILNYNLIRHGYRPFYFKSALEYRSLTIVDPFARYGARIDRSKLKDLIAQNLSPIYGIYRRDGAMIADKWDDDLGGINFRNDMFDLQERGEKFEFDIPNDSIGFSAGNVNRVAPYIINITPIPNFPQWLSVLE